MALIKLGALAQDVRGSLNGTTFSRNKGGAYVRSKVSPIQPVSDFSANSRQAFKIVSQFWAALLTDAQRADWIAFANLHPFLNVFGDSINLSGVAFFQAAMKRLQQLGFPVISTPPVTWDVTPPGVIAPVMETDGIATMSLLVNPLTPPDNANITALLFATKALAPGAQPQKTDYRMVNDFTGIVRDDTYDFGPRYLTRYNPYIPPIGSKIGLLYTYLDTTDGAIAVRSAATIFIAASVGAIIPISIVEGVDQGGGNVSVVVTTSTPHGAAVGQTWDLEEAPDVDGANGANTIASIDSPTQFSMTPFVGGSWAAGPRTGTVTRTI